MSFSLQPSWETEINFSLEGRIHNTYFCLQQSAVSILTNIYLTNERIRSDSFISFEWHHFENVGKKQKLRPGTPLNMCKVGGFINSVSSASLPWAPRVSKPFWQEMLSLNPNPQEMVPYLYLSGNVLIFCRCCKKWARGWGALWCTAGLHCGSGPYLFRRVSEHWAGWPPG